MRYGNTYERYNWCITVATKINDVICEIQFNLPLLVILPKNLAKLAGVRTELLILFWIMTDFLSGTVDLW